MGIIFTRATEGTVRNLNVKTFYWPVGLALAAGLTRTLYILTSSHDPLFNSVAHIPDANFFTQWAETIVTHKQWDGGPHPFFIGPLYGYFLALIFLFTGPNILAVRIVHVILDTATTAMIYGLTRRLAGDWPARAAGIIWACYLPAIFFCAQILPATLGVFLVTVSFYFVSRGVSGHALDFGLAGITLGLFALDRANVLLFVPAAAATFVFFVSVREQISWVKILTYLAALISVVFAVTLRNAVVGGEWVVISSQGGINFYIGNGEKANGTYWDVRPVRVGGPSQLNRDLALKIAEEETGTKMTAAAASEWWFKRGIAELRAAPKRALSLYWRKFRLFTNDYEVPLNVDFTFARFANPVHKVPFPWFAFIFACGVLGFYASSKTNFLSVLTGVFVGVYGLSIIIFFISARYRLPVTPLICAFAGIGIVTLIKYWREFTLSRAVPMTAGVILLAFFSAWPIRGYTRTDNFGRGFLAYGKYFLSRNDSAKAIYYLTKARSYSPEFAPIHYYLSAAYALRGDKNAALKILREAMSLSPDEPLITTAYGNLLYETGRPSESIIYLSEAVRDDPAIVPAWVGLTDAYAAVGNYSEAAAACEKVTALAPNNAAAWLRFAELLLAAGRVDDAVIAARRAATLAPRAPGPNFIIGEALYLKGEFKTAVAYLEHETRIAPSSAKPFGLLALCRYALGEKAQARTAYLTYVQLGGDRDIEFEKEVGVSFND